jgi:flagellar hook-associated protein 1 FlgK
LNDGVGAEITSGKLKGILDMGGNSPTLSTVRGVMGQLDNLLNTIVTQINNLQAAGRDQNGNLGPAPIFQANAALNPGQALNIFHWEVNPAIVADPTQIAAAIDDATVVGGFAGVGDGRNALAIAQLRDQSFAALGTGFVDYLNGTVSKLGIDSRSYQNTSDTESKLVQSVDSQRQSISGVNVDEETIDLLRYQRAFEATSKTVSTLNEVYQTIINMIS